MLCACSCALELEEEEAFEDYVNTLSGTHSRYSLSRGNVLPEVSLPWGFNGFAPQTDSQSGGWWFHSDDYSLQGIRLTHQPSPWIGDYGALRIMAALVDAGGGHGDAAQVCGYSPTAASTVWKPYLFAADLLSHGGSSGAARVEVAPTEHGAVLRWRFPPFERGPLASGWNQTRRVFIALNSGADEAAVGTDAPSGLA